MASSPLPLPPQADAAQTESIPAEAAPAEAAPASPSKPQPPLPEHPGQWSVDDVCRWAQSQQHLADVAPVLREHAMDGHVLINYVTNTVLAEELGISAFGTRVHVLEAIETLRWNAGLCTKVRYASPPPASASTSAVAAAADSASAAAFSSERQYLAEDSLSPPPYARSHRRAHSRQTHHPSHSSQRSLSNTPESDQHRSSKEGSPDADAEPGHTHHSKRSASRVADAEKKRQKRAALKKNPVLYAEYLQKERERNARRRARLRAERGRSNSNGNANDDRPGAHAATDAHAAVAAALVASRLDSADAYDSSANSYMHATDAAKPIPSYAPFATAPAAATAVAAASAADRHVLAGLGVSSPAAVSAAAVHIHSPLQPPPHNLRRGADAAGADAHATKAPTNIGGASANSRSSSSNSRYFHHTSNGSHTEHQHQHQHQHQHRTRQQQQQQQQEHQAAHVV
ncbi:hypothetical protein GGI26_000822 [Coemansia sp. RSA 1358]|uniref:SAM domain-containing protein n=1 Tax=Coemansia umbellata TaxID=1424467 RepID=A0ABQ8PM46_9FUNG|nr:hypothetical protein EDC05_003136 [Coemansia umbellata]KAJ2625352.1 hypothetical protein GGI26_000822 [Coemansia sp. RSA 1358]